MIAKSHEPSDADRALLTGRMAKVAAGERPNREEDAAFRRYQKQLENADRWNYYKTIPKSHWLAMSGTSYATLKHHSGRYGVPVQTEIIDLSAVARWLHDFLSRNAAKLANDADDPAMSDRIEPGSAALERYRQERFLMVRLDRMERERTLVDRAKIHEAFAIAASVLRRAGDNLACQFGEGARRLLNQAIDDAERTVNNVVFAPDDNAAPSGTEGGNGDGHATT